MYIGTNKKNSYFPLTRFLYIHKKQKQQLKYSTDDQLTCDFDLHKQRRSKNMYIQTSW